MADLLLPALLVLACLAPADPPAAGDGWVDLFNGRDLEGWHGLVGTPLTRAAMSEADLAAARAEADAAARAHWRAEDGALVGDGQGPHLCTDRACRDFELALDWAIAPGADSGIYLRGSPQVQIWDPVHGADRARVGSGGLYNNEIHPSTPALVADRPAGEWNSFLITMLGERVSVRLNDRPVVDDVVFENYWDRSRPIFPTGQIELQTHGGELRFRNIRLRELSDEEACRRLRARDADAFVPLFNGRDLEGWTGSLDGYRVEEGVLVCDPQRGGVLLSERAYDDFVVRLEFRLPPGGNNGLALRAPREGNPAYDGLEVQILDDTAAKHADLAPYQYHGSVYGIAAAHRGYLRPVGQWNFEEVTCRGSRVTVELNGTRIVDVDLDAVATTPDGHAHPGLERRRGHVGFMGHGDRVEFRHVTIRALAVEAPS